VLDWICWAAAETTAASKQARVSGREAFYIDFCAKKNIIIIIIVISFLSINKQGAQMRGIKMIRKVGNNAKAKSKTDNQLWHHDYGAQSELMLREASRQASESFYQQQFDLLDGGSKQVCVCVCVCYRKEFPANANKRASKQTARSQTMDSAAGEKFF